MPNPKPAILVATALGIAVGMAVSVKPWAAFFDQREEAKAVGADLKQVRGERARLEREEAKARSEVGRETKAREAGFRAKGERDLTPPPLTPPVVQTQDLPADGGSREEKAAKEKPAKSSDGPEITITESPAPASATDATNDSLR